MRVWVKLLILCSIAGGFSYLVANRHADYYMGTKAETSSCYGCHVDAVGINPVDRLQSVQYRSPLNMAISGDGSQLLVTSQDSNSVLLIDTRSRSIEAEIQVGRRPNQVIYSDLGDHAYVSNEWSDTISVVDLRQKRVIKTFQTGNMPSGIAQIQRDNVLYVSNWQGDSVSMIDLESGEEQIRFAGGGSPNVITLSPDGNSLYVSNELSYLSTSREPPVSEVTVIDTLTRRVRDRIRLENTHLLEDIEFISPELAVVALVTPKNLLPVLHVNRGWAMGNGIGVINVKTGATTQLLLDEFDQSYADPFGLAVSPDGKHLFVSHSGVNKISVLDTSRLKDLVDEIDSGSVKSPERRLDLSSRFVLKRIPTGSSPKGMAVSPKGDYLYVAERLQDQILAIDLATLEPAFSIPVGTRVESVIRKGERLFNSASRTFQGQFSCRSCHPRNHVDRLQYDFEPDGLGINIVDNRSLLGVRGTAPFKWNGKNTSMFMQCGIRFARILTRVHPFPEEDLSALVAFLRSLPAPPNPNRSASGELTPSQQRGKTLFERTETKDGELIEEVNRCITCHPPPLFTNRKSADVGSASPTDLQQEFDTAHLLNIYNSAPYLHDGKAKTLEEIWTLYNAEDKHGVTRDMNNKDLNDLIEYLKTL